MFFRWILDFFIMAFYRAFPQIKPPTTPPVETEPTPPVEPPVTPPDEPTPPVIEIPTPGSDAPTAEEYAACLIDVTKVAKTSKLLSFPVAKSGEKVSPYFKLGEHFQQAGFIGYKSGRGSITAAMVAAITEIKICAALARLLHELRADFRKAYPDAIIVLRPRGGYRPEKFNYIVGGASGSQHRYGRGADIWVKYAGGKYLDAATMAITAERYMWRNGYKGGIGVYGANDVHIHVDTRGAFLAWYDTYSATGTPIAKDGRHTQGARPCSIRKGHKCAGVVLIQRYLGLKTTGYFKDAEVAALKAWQGKNGLAVDGVYGIESNKVAGIFDWAS